MDKLPCLRRQRVGQLMRSLSTELKRLGVDHPDKGFVSAFTRGLSGQEKSSLRSEFRENLLQRQGRCQMTGSKIGLVASHIKPFDHCVDEFEAVYFANGLLLRKDLDYLFDKGFISFDDKRRLMISADIKSAVGRDWVAQMQIAIGEEALRHWSTGGDKCKVKGITIPPKEKELPGAWLGPGVRAKGTIVRNPYRKQFIAAAKAREEFMDYHRRHIFKWPEVQGV